jgi:hypothetical protein
MASALDQWAASREQAVKALANQAACLLHQGSRDEAAYFRMAARRLRVRALHERAKAAALREIA